MTTFQKIIKYGALIFAGYLCLMIITGMVFGITAMIGITTGIEMLEENSNSEIVTAWEQEYTNISEMDIDLSLCKLDIRKGDTLKVNVSNVSDRFKCEANGNKLKIEDKRLNRNFLNMHNITPTVIIYVPENIQFDKVSIDTGVNDTNIEYLKTDKLDVDMGVGKVILTSEVLKNADIECGVGKLELNLIGKQEDYRINAEAGLGNFEIAGQKVSNHQTFGNGNALIKIEAGIGEVIVNFK